MAAIQRFRGTELCGRCQLRGAGAAATGRRTTTATVAERWGELAVRPGVTLPRGAALEPAG